MLQNCSVWRTAAVFFREPTKEHYIKDLSRRVGLAHTSIRQHVNELVKLGLIGRREERRGSRLFPLYCARRDAALFRHYKRLYNLDSLRELVQRLADTLMPQCIVLFGSYRRGEDMEESDIDLHLQCEPEEIDLHSYEERLGRKIQLHFRADFGSLPEELKNSLVNGIVLHGYLVAYDDGASGSRPRQGAGAAQAGAHHARAARAHRKAGLPRKHAR